MTASADPGTLAGHVPAVHEGYRITLRPMGTGARVRPRRSLKKEREKGEKRLKDTLNLSFFRSCNKVLMIFIMNARL